MKDYVIVLLVSLLVATGARGQDEQASDDLTKKVREVLLDQRSPVTVNVAMHGITTLQFPAHIAAVDGDGFAEKLGPDVQFLMSAGENWVSIKSVAAGVERNLNVIINHRVYPILIRTRSDSDYDYAVLFHEPSTGPLPKTSLADVRRTVSRKKISTARIIGFLDKMKGYPTFSQTATAMYIGMDMAEPAQQGKGLSENDQIKTQIVRVLRDNTLDAIGFELLIENKTDTVYRYDPTAFALRVGSEVYNATLGDGAGAIPARQRQTAFFIVAGSAESGVPNDLSVLNDFTAIVRQVQ